MQKLTLILVAMLMLLCSGCIIAPLLIAETLDVKVIDAKSSKPISNAKVIYLICDVHDFDCHNGILVQTTSNEKGEIKIDSRRKWNVWIPAPGGFPSPNHFLAIWAAGYSTFIFGQYDDTVESWKQRIKRIDIMGALNSIPDHAANDLTPNGKQELNEGTIHLHKFIY